jgi:hypothetical protein
VSREAKPLPSDVHLASDEAVLGLGAFGALAALPAAPVVAAAIIVGLGIFAAHKAYEHFTTSGGLEDRSRGAISKAVPPKDQPEVVPEEGQQGSTEEKDRSGKTAAPESVETKDLTRLSPGEIRMLKKGGFNIHGEKTR